jgi:hypothetical protein
MGSRILAETTWGLKQNVLGCGSIGMAEAARFDMIKQDLSGSITSGVACVV